MPFSARRKTARLCLWLCFISACFTCSPSYSGAFNESYDAEIEEAVRRYWIDLPVWRLWKAQLYQESRLDPQACSGKGACGLAQFMSGTWRDVLGELCLDGAASRSDARLAIAAGAYYQAKLRRTWDGRERAPMARNDLALASYNAGLGHILEAQRRCGDVLLWPAIAPCLEAVTGPSASETKGYVRAVNRWWRMMEAP